MEMKACSRRDDMIALCQILLTLLNEGMYPWIDFPNMEQDRNSKLTRDALNMKEYLLSVKKTISL